MVIPAFQSLTSEFARALRINLATAGGRVLVMQYVSFWDFDEQWYIRTYPDLEDMPAEHFSSPWHHFMLAGYFEERLPVEPTVDDQWYMKQYEDVAAAIVNGIFSNGREHYTALGRAEGRVPSKPQLDPIWYAPRYLVNSHGEKPTLQACLDHFVRWGYRNGALPRLSEGHPGPRP